MFSLIVAIISHALYISHTEVEVTDEYCKATCKIFADDLADAVRVMDESIISRDGTYDSLDLQVIERYLSEHLYAISKGDTMRFEIYDFSNEGESVWLELYKNLPNAEIDHFHNSLLVETFPTQGNMLKVKTPSAPYLIRLHKGKTELHLKN